MSTMALGPGPNREFSGGAVRRDPGEASFKNKERGYMAVTTKRLGAASVYSILAAWAGNASAEMKLNFPEPAAGVAQEIYDIRMLTSGIAAVLLVIIFAVVGYSLVYHRKSRGYEAD